MTTDSDLLRQFATHGDEAAFAEVVRRQADLVYSVALRVTANSALAQDVTQTVFTLLARRAGTLAHYDTLVGWLHTTTRHTAINTVRGEERRRAREQEATAMQITDTAPSVDWEQLRPILDEAVDSLGEDDRKAVLLRYFKNLSHQEVGVALGLNEDTARKRVERALEKLRDYFSRRGITATAAILATAISANSVQAAPTDLAFNATQAALTSAAAAGTAGSTLLFLLMSTKTKAILAATAIIIIGGTVAFMLQAQGPSAVDSPGNANSAATLAKVAVIPAKASSSTPTVVAPFAAAVMSKSVTETGVTSSALASTVATITFGPKSDLNEAILAAIQALETQDTRGFLQTMMPPSAARTELSMNTAQQVDAAALDAMVEKINQTPAGATKLTSMLTVLTAIQEQNLKPSLNDAGTRATYTFEPPMDGHKVVIFNKVDGNWYLNGM